VGTTTPFAQDTPVANLNATLTEGGGGGYKAYLDQAAKAGDTITLSASGASDKISAILGDTTVAFSGGQVTLTLTEGQTEVAFAIVNSADLEANVNGCLFDLQALEDAVNLVAAHARNTGTKGIFSCKNRRTKTRKQDQKHGLKSKTAHVYSMRLAGHKWMGRRMDSAWGTSGYLACIAANASNSARSAA
jgi:hypothetical protein